MRGPFDTLFVSAGVVPHIAAEVDEMAMLRLLVCEGVGVALVPPVVVRDELRDGHLREISCVRGLIKPFFAVTLSRRFPNPLVRQLIEAARKPPEARRTLVPGKASEATPAASESC